MNVHLYYDPDKAAQESRAFYELLERQENDLKTMEEPPDRKLHYDTISRSYEFNLYMEMIKNISNIYEI